MRFYVKKRRQAPAVIIVALIDILIVLLIFLMATTTLKKQQPPSLKLALPESSQAQKAGANENPPLVVTVDPAGNLRLGPESKPVTVERFKTELIEAAAKTPDLKLAINADKAAPFGQIVRIMDAAREAKVKMVNAFTKQAASP